VGGIDLGAQGSRRPSCVGAPNLVGGRTAITLARRGGATNAASVSTAITAGRFCGGRRRWKARKIDPLDRTRFGNEVIDVGDGTIEPKRSRRLVLVVRVDLRFGVGIGPDERSRLKPATIARNAKRSEDLHDGMGRIAAQVRVAVGGFRRLGRHR
jgi:hypothetical protein